MSAIDVVLASDPDDSRLDAVRAILRAHNREANPVFLQELESTPASPVLVLALTGEGSVAGGLIGETRGRWFKVGIMAVRRELRRTGIGSRLLESAEREATSRGCDRVFVDTMDYQAPAFYERRGYARQCELPDWDSHGHSKLLYAKKLGDAPR